MAQQGIVLNPPDKAEERNNWRVITAMVNELYFTRSYRPGAGVLLAGGAVEGFSTRAATIDYPNAGTTSWRLGEERPSRWRRAGIRWTVRYTVDAAGGGNFRVRFQVAEHGPGDNIATVPLYSSDQTIAAPAAAGDVAEAVFVDTTSTIIPGLRKGLSLLLLRLAADAADTSANVLKVTQLVVEVLPQGGG